MKTKLVLGAVAAAVAVFSQGAFAQASSPTRAEVKSEAKSGGLAPAGQGPVVAQPSKASDKTRDERKAQTKADKASGNLKPAGEAAGVKEAQPAKGSTVDRDTRKSDTKAAVKSGKTQPAGEAAQPSGEPPKK
jgi:hypothetical protein